MACKLLKHRVDRGHKLNNLSHRTFYTVCKQQQAASVQNLNLATHLFNTSLHKETTASYIFDAYSEYKNNWLINNITITKRGQQPFIEKFGEKLIL